MELLKGDLTLKNTDLQVLLITLSTAKLFICYYIIFIFILELWPSLMQSLKYIFAPFLIRCSLIPTD